MDGNSTPLIHRTAERIAKRMSEILGETISVDQVYAWRHKGLLHTYELGGTIAITEMQLLQDLSGKTIGIGDYRRQA